MSDALVNRGRDVAIEAIVMVADEPVAPDLLAQLLELPTARVERAVRGAGRRPTTRPSHGFELVKVAGGYRYQTHPDLAPYVERFVLDGQPARLSAAALETLAIVAYKQPVSRAQIAAIRGVDPDGVLRTLQARGYVDEVARDPGPGLRRILYGTTRLFLEKLGLDSLADLPPIAEFVPGAEVVEALGARPARAPQPHRSAEVTPTARGRSAASAGLPASGCRRCWRGGWGVDGSRGLIAPVGDRQRRGGDARRRGRSGHRPRRSRRCPDRRPTGSRVLPAQQAGGRRHDGQRPARSADGGRPGPSRAASVSGRPARPDTEGLLLLTNDGDLTHRLTHPSHGVDKEYLAEVEGRPSPGALRRLRDGVELDDGVTAPAKASLVEPDVVRLTIHEGRNRQVRRMCEAIGHPGDAARANTDRADHRPSARAGEWRTLTTEEVRNLERAAAGAATTL